MAIKNIDGNEVATVKDGQSVAGEDFPLALEEYCRRISTKKISPELIGGFHHVMVKIGQISATESEFEFAFKKFASQPV